jgi:phospholipid/cholesterol/gamma-HCH transport system substrate-binding protein
VIPRRVWINLGVFFALFAWLCLWAVQNVITLDVVERPYTITAAFDSAPGLRENVEVTYLGVRVGTIQELSLEQREVVVSLGIDKDTDLPVGITAAIRRKSAVGEPYVALEPPEGYEGGGATIDHDAGYPIPIESTSVPLAYGDLFVALDDLVDAVPGEALGSVLDELATALDGRGPELRRLLESTDDLTTTLAERTEMFDQLATELTSLTHTIAQERDAVGRSFDNLAALTGTLADSRADLDRLLTEAPVLGRQVDALLQATIDDLGCTFGSIGELFARIGDPSRIAELLRVLDVAAEADAAFNAAVIEKGDAGADGPYLTGSFGLVADDPPPIYEPRPELPAVPGLPRCGELNPAAAAAAGASATADGDGQEPGDGPHEVDVSDRPAAPAPSFPESSDVGAGDQRFPLGLALAGVGAALFAVLVVAARARRGRAAAEDAD